MPIMISFLPVLLLVSGLITRNTYNAAGHITASEKDYGNGEIERETLTYDSRGYLRRKTDDFGYVTEYEHDAKGRLLSVKKPDVGTFNYAYDEMGRLIATEDPAGYVEERYYKDGKLSSIKYPDGTLEKFGWKGDLLERRRFRNGLFILYKHDSQGNVIQERLFSRREEEEIYDARSRYDGKRLVSKEDPLGHTTFYFYNSKGQCVSERLASTSTKDPEHPTTKRTDFTYNENGNVIQEKRWVSFSDFLICKKEYDDKGRLIKEELVGAPPIYTSYDAFDNVIQVRVGDLPLIQAAYTYGTRLSFSNGKKITYRKGERFIQETLHPNGLLETAFYDASGRIIEVMATHEGQLLRRKVQEYDPQGNLTTVTTFEGDQMSVSSCEYGPCGKQIRDPDGARLSYDQFGELSSIEKENSITMIEYNPEALPSKRHLKRDNEKPEIVFLAKYDALRRQIGVCSKEYTHSFRTYNHLGLIVEEKVRDDYGTYSVRFEYDRIGRLIRILLPDDSHVFYEFAGPLLKKIHRFAKGEKTPRYSHAILERDHAGRATLERLISGSTLASTYEGLYCNALTVGDQVDEKMQARDCYGNPVTLLQNKHTTHFTRNLFGELVHEKSAPPAATSFTKDGYGRRVLTTAPEIRRLFYLGDSEIGAVDKQGNLVELKIPKEITDGVASGAIAIEIKKRVYAPVFDLAGNIAYLFRQKTGTLAEYYRYSQSGDEQIYKGDGTLLDHSRCKNPWRWQGARREVQN